MGCSGAAPVPAPTPTGLAEAACTDFMADLPDEVAGEARRQTDPESPWTSAWGDPAITVRCGVADPAALGPTADLITVDDIDWFPEELTAGYTFTSYDRVANVEVTVPDDYAPEITAVTELSPLVSQNVPSQPTEASGGDSGESGADD